MVSKSTIDLDAIIPKREEEREIKLGGRTFVCSDIPVGVGIAFLRVRTDPTYSLPDAMIDASIAMLNQGLPDGEKIDRAWLLGVLDGSTIEPITDVILSPFYEAKVGMTRPKPENQTTL